MVSLQSGILKLGTKTYTIIDYKVWFVTPSGLCTTLDQAIEVCSAANVSVDLNVRPICVAITDQEGVYEQI